MEDLRRGYGALSGLLCSFAILLRLMPTPASGSPISAPGAGANERLWIQRFQEPLTHNYLSPVHDVPAGFRSAVVSWDTNTPSSSWIEVQLRARIGDSWTNWYDMGHWSGDLSSGFRHSVKRSPDAYGHVDTDTLNLKTPANALQVQVLFHPGAGGAQARLSLVAVTTDAVANNAGKADDTHDAARPAWGSDIDVPQRTQRVVENRGAMGGGGDSWCSPTSVSMVMAYWAAKLDHPEWNADVPASAAGTFDSVYDGCGNWPFNVAFASEHGLAGWVERLASLDDIGRYLNAGVPIIASIKASAGELEGAPYPKTDGHLLVVRGFTSTGDVIVNDPYGLPGTIRRTYRRQQFAHAWLGGSGGIVYVIGPPDLLSKLR